MRKRRDEINVTHGNVSRSPKNVSRVRFPDLVSVDVDNSNPKVLKTSISFSSLFS
jgi:hypothetical protein